MCIARLQSAEKRENCLLQESAYFSLYFAQMLKKQLGVVMALCSISFNLFSFFIQFLERSI